MVSLSKLYEKPINLQSADSRGNSRKVIGRLILSRAECFWCGAFVVCVPFASTSQSGSCTTWEECSKHPFHAWGELLLRMKPLQGSMGCTRASQAGGSKDSFKIGGENNSICCSLKLLYLCVCVKCLFALQS